MSFISSCKDWFNRAMTEPDVNSRFVFLIHGIAITLGTIALVTAFIVVHDKSAYPTMLASLGGSAAAGGLGRWLTKKNGGDDSPLTKK